MNTNPLTENDYALAAAMLGCEVAAIKAVCDVEAPQGGFVPPSKELPKGFVRCLFEGHHFHKHTSGLYDLTHPDISYRRWDKKKYRSSIGEVRRFGRAYRLNPSAAIRSASWGKFQILGSNHAACGYATPEEFFVALTEGGELGHLRMFIRFIEHEGLADHLRKRQWAKFARKYNGPRYRENGYDTKLAKAYMKHSRKTG